MGDELKRYRWYYNGMLPDFSGGLCKYEDAAAAIEQLQAQLAQAREQVERLTSDVSAQKKTTEIHAYQAAQYYAELEQLRERLAARNGFKASTEAEGDAYAFGFMDGIDEANKATAEDGKYVYGIGSRLFVTGSKAAIQAISMKLGRTIKLPKAESEL